MVPRCIGLAAVAACFLTTTVRADVVIDWNAIATRCIVDNVAYQNPGMASRTLAMVNLAMYDTINSIQPAHTLFYSHGPAPAGASPQAAAAQSAYEVMKAIYPDQTASLDASLASSLGAIPDGPAKTSGIAFGQTVAANVLAQRQNDGFDGSSQYVPTGGAGHWEPDPTITPTQEAWGPAWGDMQPFALASTAPYMPPPPPEMTSQAYADTFNTVKELGRLNSATRTQEQTNIGLFWAYDRQGMGTPMNLFDQILCTVATQQGNSLSDNARLFAMASVAMADAGIVAWDSKFAYDLWRPISGIRRADEDGNPLTDPDPTWVPLGAPGGDDPDFTPPFPTYVSGHATFGGALFEILKDFYGTDDIAFSATSAELTGPEATRHFASFSKAMAENGVSRVYLGIHWHFDDTVGQIVGQQVADAVGTAYFQPIPEPTTAALTLGLGGLMLMCRRRAG